MLLQERIAAARHAGGVPDRVDEPRFRNVGELLQDVTRRFGERPAFSSLGYSLTYAELDRRSAQFAAWLQHDFGLQPGDRVAIQMPNLVQYPVAVFGVLRAGGVVVNTNPLYTVREMVHQFNDAGVRLVVALANFADRLAAALPQTGIERVVVTEVGDLQPPLRRLLVNGVARYVKKAVPKVSVPKSVSLSAVLKAGAAQRHEEARQERDELAVLQYTGGTTGVSKGAMLSHGNLLWNAEQAGALLRTDPRYVEGEEVVLLPLPMYHIYCFTVSLILMGGGNHAVLVPDPRNLDALIDDFERWRVTSMTGINTLFVALCDNERFRKLDFSRFKTTSSGGMALTSDAARRWKEVTGVEVGEGYGMTETAPTVSANPREAIRLGTIGVAVPNTEIRVVDDDGRDLDVGEAGELLVRGPQVMLGYWQRPDETARVLDEDGWLRTGDIALVDEEGYLRIVDRKKDMIVVSGFNVYPNEIEDVVSAHDDVVECAVIGVADAKSGEVPKLFVVRRNPQLDERAILDWCRERLTGYKMPRHVEFRDSLPKSNVGKILRRELRDGA